MVQFNLLPDVKIQFIKARRTKRLVILTSILVGSVSLFVFILMMFSVNVVQRKSLSDLNKDITLYSTQLKSVKDVDKVLTVQNQLGTLTKLHTGKPVTSRLFTYLTQLTPQDASLNKMTLDFSQSTLTITGVAPGLDTVNAFTDTLKTTKFTTAEDDKSKAAFPSVVLTAFSRDDKGAAFTITTTFDSAIFAGAEEPKLTIPAGPRVDPAALFQKGGV